MDSPLSRATYNHDRTGSHQSPLPEDPVENNRIRQSHDKQETRADRGPWWNVFLARLAVAELCHDMTWRRTNYSTDLSDAIDLISHIGADSDGHVLLIDEPDGHVVNFTGTHYSYYDGAVPE